MSDIESMDVTVYGRSFGFKTTPDKAKILKEAAGYLHDKMHEVAKKMGTKDFEGLIVAASMNIIAEYDEKLRKAAATINEAPPATSKPSPPVTNPPSSAEKIDSSRDQAAIALFNEMICHLLAEQ